MAAEPRLYLDWNASAPLCEAARTAMVETMALCGNPSSVHAQGRALRQRIEEARAGLAAMFEVLPRQVIFTSGATEAAALALSPVVRSGGGEVRFSRLFVSAIEHPCVLSGGRFPAGAVEILPVTPAGVIDLEALDASLSAHDAAEGAPMVALMAANNETGAIQPVREAAKIVHRHGGLLVCDAVQGFGRIDIRPQVLEADFLLVSAHKIAGPAGAGALVCAHPGVLPEPLLRGGGQENHNRAGTENAVAIAGFAAAAASLGESGRQADLAQVRDFIEAGIVTICSQRGVAAPVVFAAEAPRLANTSCFAVPGVAAETALISLDLSAISASSGSACSSGKVKRSHVLHAMAVGDDLARSALRISLGSSSTVEDARRFLAAFDDIVGRMAGSRAA